MAKMSTDLERYREFDHAALQAYGVCLSNSFDGVCEVQRIDEIGAFEDDYEALLFCMLKAAEGEALFCEALYLNRCGLVIA